MQQSHVVDQKLDRVSLVLNSTERESEYKAVKTPDTLENGALRSGAHRSLYSKENLSLFLNYACVGICENAFAATVYPYLNNYLHMDGYQTTAAGVLMTLPWSFKTFIGMFSDCFPVLGYRRRPYIMFGWTMCLVTLVYMAINGQVEPYWKAGEINAKPNASERDILNETAPYSGSKYIVLMMLATLGYVIADVCCDALMVEVAQLEPENVRGSTQSMAYLSRFVTGGCIAVIYAVCFNGEEYGGTFSWSLSFSSIMGITIIAPALGLLGSVFVADSKVPGERFSFRLKEMIRIAQKRSVWQLMAFNFFNALLFDASASPANILKTEWAKVTPLLDGVVNSGLSTMLLGVAIWVTKKYFLQTSWRKTVFFATVSAVTIQWLVDYLLVFDVVRKPYFYVGAPLATNLPAGIRFIVCTFATVEIAEEGYEGVTYGLITTMNNLAAPLASAIYNQIDANFDVFQKDIVTDSAHVRSQVAIVLFICYFSKICSTGTLFLLPNQKAEAQALRRHGGSYPKIALVMFVIALFALVWGVMTNVMSIYESTACLKLAGGPGCLD